MVEVGGAYGRVEDIDGLDRSLPLLLQAEHQVDPLAQGLGHLVRLQRLAVDQDEEAGVVPRPRRQVDVVHPLAILTHAKVKTCKHRFYHTHADVIITLKL